MGRSEHAGPGARSPAALIAETRATIFLDLEFTPEARLYIKALIRRVQKSVEVFAPARPKAAPMRAYQRAVAAQVFEPLSYFVESLDMDLAAGQSWTYRAPPGFETSRLLIGAIASFGGEQHIVCAAAVHAPRKHADGHLERVTIPFLPMTEAAFRASILARDDTPEPLPEAFGEKLTAWQSDPRGLTTFTVPFEGFLDQMIAHQMAEIAGLSAA